MDFLPFSKLSQKNISPRVRNVLESSYQLVWKEFEAGLKRSFEELDRELFKQAEKAATNDKQNRLFEAQKALRQANSLISIAARDDFQRGMLGLLDPARAMHDKEVSPLKAALSLVDESKLEIELAHTEIAARWEMKCSSILTVTAVRFAVISGGAPVMLEQIPVGPHRILAAVCKALEGVDLKSIIKVEFMRCFDRQMLVRMPEILDALNQQFVEQRVFANLNIATSKKPEVEELKADEKKAEDKKAEDKQAPEKSADKQANETQSGVGNASHAAQGAVDKQRSHAAQGAVDKQTSHAAQGAADKHSLTATEQASRPTNVSPFPSKTAPAPGAPNVRALTAVPSQARPHAPNAPAPKADPFGFFNTGPSATPSAAASSARAIFDIENLPPLVPPSVKGAPIDQAAAQRSGVAKQSQSGTNVNDKTTANAVPNAAPSAPANPGHSRRSTDTPNAASGVDKSHRTGGTADKSHRTGGTPSKSPSTQGSDGASPELDLELFSTLRELLGGRRAAQETNSGAALPAPSGPVASTQDVQSVLSVLQTLHSAPVMVGNRWKSRRVSDVKTDLMAQLRQLYGGQNPRLDQEVSDTVDLVGMLFDHVLQDSNPSSTVHSLLTKLQVPVLKVAIQDKSFFSRRNHPARQLLNSIGENSLFWGDADDVDQAVVERMQLVVDRIINEYDNDVSVFSNMLDDLSGHVSTLQRKAEVSEKRNVEAAKGREKLELARANAAKVIDQFTKGQLLPSLVVHLLEGAWADVLALTELRMDTHSPIYQERLEVAEQLAGCFDLDNPVTRDHFDDLRPVLEEGMSLVGFHGPEIERTLKAVSELVVEGDALIPALEPAEEREVTNIVRNKSRLGQDQDGDKSEAGVAPKDREKQSILAHLKKEEKIPLTPKEQQTLERLKQLPFGTWFEFVINQQGDKSKRKLSWYSTVTGRCLFVNSRGAKVAEKSLEELARDLVRGNAHVWEPSKESLIDRAWRNIKETLKNWTQGDLSVTELAAEGR
jgi:Protein of unknown function (DUF1631)